MVKSSAATKRLPHSTFNLSLWWSSIPSIFRDGSCEGRKINYELLQNMGGNGRFLRMFGRNHKLGLTGYYQAAGGKYLFHAASFVQGIKNDAMNCRLS